MNSNRLATRGILGVFHLVESNRLFFICNLGAEERLYFGFAVHFGHYLIFLVQGKDISRIFSLAPNVFYNVRGNRTMNSVIVDVNLVWSENAF